MRQIAAMLCIQDQSGRASRKGVLCRGRGHAYPCYPYLASLAIQISAYTRVTRMHALPTRERRPPRNLKKKKTCALLLHLNTSLNLVRKGFCCIWSRTRFCWTLYETQFQFIFLEPRLRCIISWPRFHCKHLNKTIWPYDWQG